MADVHSSETRSFNMSRIRNKNTEPEEVVRKYLFSRGLRYRKNDSRYLGKPDLVFPKYRVAVFINGCFWHKHIGCRYFVLPSTNPAFWEEKLEGNRLRDERNIAALQNDGWRVIIVWECELKK
jgi:DNA mismatch endonuclease (patch repair protein)